VSAQPLMMDRTTDMTVPDFVAPMTSGKTFRLSEYAGRKIVLYFYPKDNTPGCIAEGMRFRDLYHEFSGANAEIVGVSRDSLRSHESFKAKLGMPFELISDQDETVCRLFGVIKSKMMYGKQVTGVERSTFAIDAHGRIVKEWRGIKVPGHVDEVLEFMKSID
jgi:peroxiredoxin Q/BCP